jgi:sortase A
VSDILSTPRFLGGQAPSNAPVPRSNGRSSPGAVRTPASNGGSSPGAVRTPASKGRRSVGAERRLPSNGRRAPGALRGLALALIAIGALVLIDAGVTLVWQEPISALYATLRQDHLSGALKKIERAGPTRTERRALAGLSGERRRIAFLARELERSARGGSAVGRIVIPRIGADFVVVKGTSTSDLISGPGIYPETTFPGIAGTTAIAGHRTTYLAPFRHIDALHAGSVILLDMPYAHFTYTVIGQKVVAPTDVRAAVAKVGFTRLVLSACTPLFSAAKRLLVFARLTRAVPVGAARQSRIAPPGGTGRSPSTGAPPIGRPIEAPLATAGRPRLHQRCSNPSSRTSSRCPSDSVTPGRPSTTSPIQVTSTLPASLTASSARARSSGETQKHSS